MMAIHPAASKRFIRRDPIFVSNDPSFNLEHFCVPYHYKDDVSEIMIPYGLIDDRGLSVVSIVDVQLGDLINSMAPDGSNGIRGGGKRKGGIQRLARDIREDYGATTIHLLCVLKGGSAYFHELVAALRNFHEFSKREEVPFTYDFIKVKSYKSMDSSGSVQITGGDLAALEGKDVLVVEDIVDTGLSMDSLLPVLEARGTGSLRVTSLLEKRTERSSGYKADYVGFSIPDKFVVGFCLDFNEAFRDLKHICVISEKGIERFKETRGEP